ncbi:hypothetical protein HDU67_003525 [Dinochytrium kinnereticum]|nr:hypothetical protein HDU67_003525 [Dinochytrium kinnereticum]
MGGRRRRRPGRTTDRFVGVRNGQPVAVARAKGGLPVSSCVFAVVAIAMMLSKAVDAADSPQCGQYNGTVCSGKVSWSVLSTQAATTESFLEKQLDADYFKSIRAFDPNCAEAWQRWLCTNYFQDCKNSVSINGWFP